jgi:hypothetical protein
VDREWLCSIAVCTFLSRPSISLSNGKTRNVHASSAYPQTATHPSSPYSSPLPSFGGTRVRGLLPVKIIVRSPHVCCLYIECMGNPGSSISSLAIGQQLVSPAVQHQSSDGTWTGKWCPSAHGGNALPHVTIIQAIVLMDHLVPAHRNHCGPRCRSSAHLDNVRSSESAARVVAK